MTGSVDLKSATFGEEYKQVREVAPGISGAWTCDVLLCPQLQGFVASSTLMR